MRLEVPAPHETFEVALEDGARIKVRRHGRPDGVRLFLSHGNGYAIDGYLPYWQHFLAAYDVIVFDFRNHGQNVPVTPANHTYAQLARDLERVYREDRARLGSRKSAGIFHSMSGRTAMKHAHRDRLSLGCAGAVRSAQRSAVRPSRLCRHGSVRGPADGVRRQSPHPFRQHRGARGRIRQVAGRPRLGARRPRADGARGAARKSEGPGFVLVCDPANEAGIYAEAMGINLWPKATAFRGPVKLIGADPDLKGGPPTGRANQALGTENGYDYSFVPGTGHLLQVEKPEECARQTLAFLGECGLK